MCKHEKNDHFIGAQIYANIIESWSNFSFVRQ